ncbi:heterokaryon incompatibility protein [Alternaria alternata]|jgi:hypothetical protein|nr:heterokaryon incompatibility protein [Alternaria alternata]
MARLVMTQLEGEAPIPAGLANGYAQGGGAYPPRPALHNPGRSASLAHNGVAAPRRRPSSSARRCPRRGAPADDAHAAVSRDAGQVDGCAQVQVRV